MSSSGLVCIDRPNPRNDQNQEVYILDKGNILENYLFQKPSIIDLVSF